jgi:hypothetical protein
MGAPSFYLSARRFSTDSGECDRHSFFHATPPISTAFKAISMSLTLSLVLSQENPSAN